MTAPAIAPVTAEAEVINRAWTVLDRADSRGCTSTPPVCAVAQSLRDALEDYANVADGLIHPAAVFGDLGHHQDDALDTALARLAEAASEWAGELARTVREHAADYVAGGSEQ